MRELLSVVFVGLVPIAVLSLIVTGTAFSLIAWQPPILQSTQFGTPNSGNGITAVASDSRGLYATGVVGHPNTAYANATPAYLFVNKYDVDRGVVWSTHFDNPYLSSVSVIGTGPSGVYVGGLANSTSFVRGFDLSGKQLWISLSGGSDFSATSITATSTGVYVGGYNRTSDFLSEYGLNGSVVWTRLTGKSPASVALYAGSDGVYLLTSSVFQKYDPDGSLLLNLTCACGGSGIGGDSTGIYLVRSVITSVGTRDGSLAKYDFAGNQLWTTTFSAPGADNVYDVGVSADSSGVYMAATGVSGRSFVIKYDANGKHIWTVQQPRETGGTAITAQPGALLLGGTASNQLAFVTLMSESSSLVFFGINPPFSFVVLAALVGVVAVSLLLLRREVRKRRRPAATSQVLRSQRIPTDLWTQPR